jgi:signal transduction histidine kinase/CHASE3 domain sensor protein
MILAATPLERFPAPARHPLVQKFGAWSILALLAIAATDAALFVVHRDATAWVAHSREVANTARDAHALAEDRRSSIDGFVITHDSALLAPDAYASRELPHAIEALLQLTADNPAQQRRALAVRAALAEWDSAYATPALASGSSARSAVLKAIGSAHFDILSRRFAEFVTAEEVLYDERRARDESIALAALVATVFPIALVALLMLALRRRIDSQTLAIVDQQSQLEEQAIELENQVEELELTNRELVDANAEARAARDLSQHALSERDRVGAFLDSALATSPIGFAFFTPDLKFVRVNERFAASRKLAPDDFTGRALHEMLSNAKVAATVGAQLQQVLDTNEAVLDVQLTGHPRPGDPPRHYLSSYFPIRRADGTLIGAGMVSADVTERLALEEQFRQSQKMEALGRLAGGVAHDFRNLLTVIRSYCDLAMLETAADDPRRPELAEIRTAADRAAMLARQLLSFGKPQPLLAVETDLNDSVSTVEGMLKRIAPATVSVTTRLAPELGRVMVDPGHVEQVLMNLAINALDAMPSGGALSIESANATIDARYAERHGVAAGDYVMLAATDTGIGMDEETCAHIFEPFFTTKEPGKGTGLGLATVYGIVAQSGGHTAVRSLPGQGTTFTIYFPRIADIDTQPRAVAERRAAEKPVAAARAEHVLVVEDEMAVRRSLTRILERVGYSVLQAEHGADGLRVAREHAGSIDLAITDLMMPEMSGREFAEQLNVLRPATRVLFMSGFTDDEVLHRGLVGERQAFIHKPFSIEDITRKVHDLLGRVD